MKRLNNRYNIFSAHLVLSWAFFFLFSIPTFAQEVNLKKGKKLFNSHCASCHKLEKRLIGPPLKGIAATRDKKWLQDWIRNSTALIDSGDVDAIAIFEEYHSMPMPSFPKYSNQDIANVMAYTDADPAMLATKKKVKKNTDLSKNIAWKDNYIVVALISIVVIIFILIILLKFKSKIISTYKIIKASRVFRYVAYVVKHNIFVLVMIFFISVIGLYFFWEWSLWLGVDKGYQPIQPIAFSHKVHSGDQEIDCQYCHSGARTSKTSGIPSANVCMNCHKFIQEGTDTGKKEIAKIYNAIGFDPETSTYIKNYEQKPIKWVRIHNLPDLVYYNHSQHVSVGDLECQTCHGPVEEMDEVYQYSSLTMTWCLDCHKTEEVKMEGNDYYENIHKQLAKKYGEEKLTIAMMGGLECGKCHY